MLSLDNTYAVVIRLPPGRIDHVSLNVALTKARRFGGSAALYPAGTASRTRRVCGAIARRQAPARLSPERPRPQAEGRGFFTRERRREGRCVFDVHAGALPHCCLTYRHHHPFVADLVSRTATFLDCINGPLVHLTGGLFFIEKNADWNCEVV
jgi:hypothetical protein